MEKIPWGREWQLIPIFLPGKYHGQRTLVGYSPWGHKELDTTEGLTFFRASQVAQWVKKAPAMQEAQVRSFGQKNPLEKEMATYSSTLAWKIPWTEEPGGLPSIGSQRVGHD